MEVFYNMQEKTFRKTLKRVAAVGTSVAMLGMTLTGALAADLSEYPKPFDGANTVFVVGSGASNEDSAAADIAAGLPASAGAGAGVVIDEADVAPATVDLTDYEKLEDPVIGAAFNATDEFGQTLDADDLEGLQDTTIDIDIDNTDDDYDVRDEIRFGGNTNIDSASLLSAHTALSYDADEDWKDRVFIPIERNSWGYYYVFEDNLAQGNFLANASATDEIEIEFLGKLFEIEGVSAATSTADIVVNVGQKFYMEAGDCVTVDGKETCLISTMNALASVSVDGVRENIAEDDEEIINGLEVRVEDVSFDEGIEYDSATLFVGEDARETFDDAEEFVGEDEDDPAWRWHIDNVHTNSPTLGIRWALQLDDPEEDDNPLYEHPLYEGDAVCLPFDYACIVFDSLQIDDYQDYELEAGISQDLYWSIDDTDNNAVNNSGEKVLRFQAKGSSDDGFITETEYATRDATDIETDTVYLAVDCHTGDLDVYREEQDGNDAIHVSRVPFAAAYHPQTGENTYGTFEERYMGEAFQIDYRDTLMDVGLHWFMPVLNATNVSGYVFSPNDANTHICPTDVAWFRTAVNDSHNITGSDFDAPPFGVMYIQPVTTRAENISIYFETDEDAMQTTNGEWNDFEYLGDSKGDTATAYDLVYGRYNATNRVMFGMMNSSGGPSAANTTYTDQFTATDLFAMTNVGNIVNGFPTTQRALDLSGWEEDTRTPEGVIILDPEAHQSSDSFEMRVPSDVTDFKVNVIVRTSGASGSGARLRDTGADGVAGPAVMKDTDVADLTAYNAIVVGGPCVNTHAADLLGLEFPTCGDSGLLSFGAGEAIIELKANGANYALLVAGYDAEDTRRAGVVLKNYEEFELSGESKVVKGEGLAVGGITLE